MSDSVGTPKTLHQAISNGYDEAAYGRSTMERQIIATIIENHIRDFLSQRFGCAFLEFEAKTKSESAIEQLELLYEQIVARGEGK